MGTKMESYGFTVINFTEGRSTLPALFRDAKVGPCRFAVRKTKQVGLHFVKH